MTLAELPTPVIMGHRGGGNIYPEHSMYGHDALHQAFINDLSYVPEADLQVLKYSRDLLVLHDSTLDRTTNYAGAASGVGPGDYKNVRIDYFDPYNHTFSDASLKMMSGREFIERYGYHRCLNFESKTSVADPMLANLILEYGAVDYSIVWVDDITRRDYFISRGIEVMAAGNAVEWSIKTAAQLKALGVNHVSWGAPSPTDMNTPATVQIYQDYFDAGIQSWMGVAWRHYWKEYRQHGFHRGGYSNDPLWTLGLNTKYSTDQFATRTFPSGHMPYTYDFPGLFYQLPSTTWGWGPYADTNGWCFWGWLCPHPSGRHGTYNGETGAQQTKAATYPFGIEFDLTLVAGPGTTRWAAMAFADTDMPVHESTTSGNTHGLPVLMIFLNASGTVYAVKQLDGVTQGAAYVNTTLGYTIDVGETNRFRLEYIDASTFKVTNVTAGLSTQFTIGTDLGTSGYIHAGTPGASGALGRWVWSDVEVV